MESAFTVTLVGQFLVLSLMALVGLIVAKILHIETTLACLLSGVLGSVLVPMLGVDTGLRAHNLKDVMFYIVLPLLIFVSAWHIDPRQLRRWFFLALLLATVGMLVSTMLTATGIFYGIGYDFPWISAFVAGAILAATDPVSVTASLKQLNAPKDLETLFEGESLFNDATAIVLFAMLITVATGGESQGSVSAYFIRVFFGGMVAGVLIGLVAAILVLFLKDKSAAIVVLVLTSFASFWLAEHILHLSGVVTVMAAAVSARLLLREQQDSLLNTTNVTWEWLGLYLNALVFSIMGLVITWDMFESQWLAMLIAIVSVTLARTIAVFGIAGLTRIAGRKIPWVWALLLSWGGLKGAIAIVLVLSLPVTLPYWWTIQSMVFGVVIFSLIIQGLSFPWLFKRLAAKNLLH